MHCLLFMSFLYAPTAIARALPYGDYSDIGNVQNPTDGDSKVPIAGSDRNFDIIDSFHRGRGDDASSMKTLPDGNYLTANRVVNNPDGSVTTWAEDGTRMVEYKSGKIVHLDQNGDWDYIEWPSGKITTHRTGGKLWTTHEDGRVTTDNDEGTVTTTYPEDGRIEVPHQDGSSTTTYPDGRVAVKNIDGSVDTKNADGTSTKTLTDGTTVTRNKDGTRTIKRTDGRVINMDRNGRTTTKNEDGSTTTVHPTGHSEKSEPEGHNPEQQNSNNFQDFSQGVHDFFGGVIKNANEAGKTLCAIQGGCN